MPPLPGKAEADPDGLFWIDLPQKERRRTLGGVLGRVDCRGVPEEWLPFLVLGRHLQAGASTHFGFGRYVVGDVLGPLETPARWLLEDALASAVPTVAGRTLQQASAKLLGEAIDTLFEDCAFAYRKGLSRAGAPRALERAYRDGFRVVPDADLSVFFEEIRWNRLFATLADEALKRTRLNVVAIAGVVTPSQS